MAVPGENVVVKVKGCEEEDVHTGMVISHANKPSSTTTEFIGQVPPLLPPMVLPCLQVWVLDLLEHRPLIIAGYSVTEKGSREEIRFMVGRAAHPQLERGVRDHAIGLPTGQENGSKDFLFVGLKLVLFRTRWSPSGLATSRARVWAT